MTEHFTDRMSEYVDGELARAEAAVVEVHLSECAACRGIAEDLRRLVARAGSLEDVGPSQDLWPAILQQIHQDGATVLPFRTEARVTRRFSFTGIQLAAAAVLLALLSGGSVWMIQRMGRGSVDTVATDTIAPAAPAAAVQLVAATEHNYDPAIRELEEQLDARRAQLDPATIEVVENSLRVIDAAIADARAALQRDPSNAFLFQRLDDNLMRKIDLLRRATTLRRAET
jgi:anti-sigma factor RsiW